MKDNHKLENSIKAASGEKIADLVLKNARIINVFSEEIEEADLAITDGIIVGIGRYSGKEEIDLGGKMICPGFIDGHIHLESSMVSPAEFEKAVIVHGTTTVVTDPHEIANVAGKAGIIYMMEATRTLLLDVFFMLPSCVPSTGLDEAGSVLVAEDLEDFMKDERVLGLAELMNSYGTVKAEKTIMDKLTLTSENKKIVDGHAPYLSGKALNAYITAGVLSDHECACLEDAMEKYKRGQWIMVREGTAARNLDALIEMFKAPYYQRTLLVTDDKHPGDLSEKGHIDYIIKKAVSRGADPIKAVKMGTWNAAQYFRLYDRGAIAPGYKADFVVMSDLKTFEIQDVYKNGQKVVENGIKIPTPEEIVDIDQTSVTPAAKDYSWVDIFNRVFHSFNMPEITQQSIQVEVTGKQYRVIKLVPNEIITEEIMCDWEDTGDTFMHDLTAMGVNLEKDILKMAVFERHHGTGHVGVGFLNGYGLKKGAVASSIAHDSHNLSVVGTNDRDMVAAANRVRENEGGLAIALEGEIVAELALPIAGLMSREPLEVVERKLDAMKQILSELGVSENIDPFMTLAFISLPVIPKLRLNTYGLIDVEEQKIENLFE